MELKQQLRPFLGKGHAISAVVHEGRGDLGKEVGWKVGKGAFAFSWISQGNFPICQFLTSFQKEVPC